MKNKNNKKTNLLTRILHDKKGIYVTTAMKIVIALVTGITVLTGSTYVVKDVVMPQTENKIIEEFNKDYSVENGGSGGTGGSTDINRSGTVPEGCTYTSVGGTVYNAGSDMPFAPETGDTYEEGDYIYTYDLSSEVGEEYGVDWYVSVKETDKSSYGNILSEISGKPVTSLNATFAGCTNLIVAPQIPNSVVNMNATFAFCSSLASAPVIPSNVTDIRNAFSGTAIEVAPVIPNGVEKMGYAFFGCSSLVDAPVIPQNVLDIEHSFENCTSLVNAPDIPNGVINMCSAFSGCSSLTSAPVIPSSLEDISFAFADCTSLSGSIEINTNKFYDFDTGSYEPSAIAGCLRNTQITEVTGETELKNTILDTRDE